MTSCGSLNTAGHDKQKTVRPSQLTDLWRFGRLWNTVLCTEKMVLPESCGDRFQ